MARRRKAGSTDVSFFIVLRDALTGEPVTGLTITDLDIQYTRLGSLAGTKVDATAGSLTAHTDNTIVEVDATDQPGLHKLDLPDAAFASGADEVAITVTGAAVEVCHFVVELLAVPCDLTHINGDTVASSAATLNLKQLNLSNSTGPALQISATNFSAAKLTGYGNATALELVGGGDKPGLKAAGGATSHGIHAVAGSVSGSGARLEAQAGNGDGLTCAGAEISGVGIRATGGDTGDGILAMGGSGGGAGAAFVALAGNGDGLECIGQGSGDGLQATGGATGNGIHAQGGATSGAGAEFAAQAGDDNGLECSGHGAGEDLAISGYDVYDARVRCYPDEGNEMDRYRVVWMKNGIPVSQGSITTPKIRVTLDGTGAALIAAGTAMTWDTANEMLEYDATDAQRNSDLRAVKIEVKATIDGAERTVSVPWGRDI